MGTKIPRIVGVSIIMFVNYNCENWYCYCVDNENACTQYDNVKTRSNWTADWRVYTESRGVKAELRETTFWILDRLKTCVDDDLGGKIIFFSLKLLQCTYVIEHNAGIKIMKFQMRVYVCINGLKIRTKNYIYI